MNKILLLTSLFGCSAVFAAFSIPYKSGQAHVKIECEVVLQDNDVYFNTPFFSLNDGPIDCACGKRALKISAKNGKVVGYCPEHTPKEERLGYMDDQFLESYKKIAEVRKDEKAKEVEALKELKNEGVAKDNGLAGKDIKKK